MRLILIRHAIAEERDPVRWPDDSLRPLTPEGIERFRRAARGLATLVHAPDAVLASPYRRTWQTAEILVEEAGWPAPRPCDLLASGGRSAEIVRTALAAVDGDSTATVALVGHEPHLPMLAVALTGATDGVPSDWKKGAAMLLEVPDGRRQPARIAWYRTARMLRDLDPDRG